MDPRLADPATVPLVKKPPLVQHKERGLPLENIYRLLYKSELYVWAYAQLYSNDGAMTKGTTNETVDAMSLKKIETIIDAIRHERYRWTPVKRISIPKKSGKLRPLRLPSWSICRSEGKTLIVCRTCHEAIHARRSITPQNWNKSLASRVS
jgi:hypothetical protein